MSLNFCSTAIFKQEVDNFIWQFYSVVRQDFSVSNWMTCFQKWVENFSFHFKHRNHARKMRLKNDIFLWCRYRVKNWLKTVCTLKCKSTRLSNDNEFMPNNLHVFCGEPQHFCDVIADNTKRIWILLKKITDWNYARMYTEISNALSNSKFQIITVVFSYLVSVDVF